MSHNVIFKIRKIIFKVVALILPLHNAHLALFGSTKYSQCTVVYHPGKGRTMVVFSVFFCIEMSVKVFM